MLHTTSQNFSFPDPKTKDPRERRIQRMIEMIPGFLTWTTLLGMIIFSFFLPIWAAIFVIVFDIYWIHKAFYISIFSLAGHRDVVEGKRINWWERCQNIAHPEVYSELLKDRIQKLYDGMEEMPLWDFRNRRTVKKEIRRLKKIRKETRILIPLQEQIMDWREVIHVVLLPTAGEPADIIEPAIQSLAENNFPKEQMIVLLATEERESPETRLSKA